MSAMQTLIQEDDIPYENELIKQPDDFNCWWRYLQFKADRPLVEQAFIFERATAVLNRSYKIWKLYLDIRAKNARNIRCQQEFGHTYSLYERALSFLAQMPRLWTDYLELRLDAPNVDITETRRTFDRALQSLSTTQHDRIWNIYLRFAEAVNPLTRASIWSRYIETNPQAAETAVEHFVDSEQYAEAIKLLVKLLDDPLFESAKEKSRYNVWEDLVELLVYHFPQELQYDESYSPERIIKSGLAQFHDQRGRLWVQLATYWIGRGHFEKARDVFEDGITNAMTIRDFTLVFDSYVEFEENFISQMMDKQLSQEHLDRYMEIFEQLMDRRPFLINDLYLRQNPNNVHEWEKRVILWGDNAQEIVSTYNKAFATINPKKATGKFYTLWVKFAKFYEEHGDITTARTILDKATKVPYKSINELAEVWIEWAEMELRLEEFDRATKVMETATRGPKKSNIDFFDETKSIQERLHKSMKVWSFYVDLVESTGTLDDVKPLYDRIFELKIGTTLTFVNYAQLLEENDYFEEAFKVYERGIDLFSYPVAFELWNIYLHKAVERNIGIERLRDTFEQALESCPPELSKPIYLMYGKLEEDRGLVRNAIKIYDRAVKNVAPKDRLETYRYYISRVAENVGLPSTRQVFQQAIDNLDDKSANAIGQEFIVVEEKLGEIDRARALYGFVSQFNDPDVAANNDFWQKWHEFEVQYGAEDTYKEMLRIKRSVKASFEKDIHSLVQKEQAGALSTAGIGFVVSSEKKENKLEASEHEQGMKDETVHNPDEIDL